MHLTPSDHDLLALLESARTPRQIASALGIPTLTVLDATLRLYRAFAVSSRARLVAAARMEDIPATSTGA